MPMMLMGGAVHAADHYVRAGGTGSGADWANALGQLPPTLTRGDTYWVASGSYPGYAFTTPEAGSALITVKKATAGAHGSGAGWQAAYGEGVAVWGPMSCSTSFVVFDGVTGEGKSGHGFEIFDPAGTSSLFQFQNAPKNVTISHVNMHFKDRLSASGDAVYGDTPCQNITVSHCYIHDIGRCPVLMRRWQNLLLEHCWIARNHSTPEQHAEGISTHGGGGHIVRFNVWEDIEGTAVIVNLAEPTSNWEIYGNCFFQNPGSGCTGVGHGIVGDNFGDSGVNGLKFYNNSAWGITGVSSGLRFWASGSTGIVAANNVWFQCKELGFNQVSHDYNSYYDCAATYEFASGAGQHEVSASGDPFAGSAAGDFHLKAATAAGTPLAAPWNVDPENKTRGSDGNWDRGAFELGGTPNPAAATASAGAMATSGTLAASAGQPGKTANSGAAGAVSGATQSARSGAAVSAAVPAATPAVAAPTAAAVSTAASPSPAPDAISRATQPAQTGGAASAAPVATPAAAAPASSAPAASGSPPAVAPVPIYPVPAGMVTPVYSAMPDAVSGATQTAAGGAPVAATDGTGAVPGEPGAADAVSGDTQTAAGQQAGGSGMAGGAASAGNGRSLRRSGRRNARAAKAKAHQANKSGGNAPASGKAPASAAPASADRGYIRVVVGGSSNASTSGTGALIGASALPTPIASGGSSVYAPSGGADAVSGATRTANYGAATPQAPSAAAPASPPPPALTPAPAPVPVAAPVPAPAADSAASAMFILPPIEPAPSAQAAPAPGAPTPTPPPAVAEPTATPGARDGGSATGPVAAVPDEGPKPETDAVAVAVRMAAEAHLAEAARAMSDTTVGLVAAYGFGQESKEGVVKDLSGHGNDGVAMGARWTPTGKFGGCMVFGGAGDRITVPDSASLDLSQGMTLEAWICPAGSLSGWRSVLMKEQTRGADYYLYANTQYDHPGTSVFIGNEVLQIGGERLALNAWTHLAATYDGAAQRLYVNGREVARRPQRGAIRSSPGLLQIGGNTVWGEDFMGRIDEVRIYNRALSAAEVAHDMYSPVKPAAAAPEVKAAQP